MGADYRITKELAIGLVGEYFYSWTSLGSGGNLDVNSGCGGVYATYFNHGFYLNAAAYGGGSNYSASRAGLGGLASGSTGGAEFSTFGSGGYDWHFGALSLEPIAARGWQQALFATPVTLTPGTIYVISYHTSTGYSANSNFFATAVTSGPITAPSTATAGGNGVHIYGSAVAFPSN